MASLTPHRRRRLPAPPDLAPPGRSELVLPADLPAARAWPTVGQAAAVMNLSQVLVQVARLATELGLRDHSCAAFAAGVRLLALLGPGGDRADVLAYHFEALIGIFGEEELVAAVRRAATRRGARR